MNRISSLAAIVSLAGATCAQEGVFVDTVVTTSDGDSVLEPGEVAFISIFVQINADEEIAGFAAASFDTIGGNNADTGEIIEFGCLNHLCGLVGDLTTTDGVNLFNTEVVQLPPIFGPFLDDNPIAVYQFVWQTDDFTPRVVHYTTDTQTMLFYDEDNNNVEADVVEADIAFCVGACPGFAAVDLPFGLVHETVGLAQLSTNETGELALQGVGMLKQGDGMNVELGDAEFHRLCYEASGVDPGYAWIEVRSIGMIDGMPDEKLFILEEETLDGGKTGQFKFTTAQPETMATVEVLLGGEVVAISDCADCPPHEEVFSRFGFGNACVTPWRRGSDATEPSAMLRIEFGEASVLMLPGGEVVTGDEVRVHVEGAVFVGTNHASTTTVSAIGIASLAIPDESLGTFGFAHRSLDGAALGASNICPDCSLTLSNIGASGDDGVSVGHGAAEAFCLNIEPKPEFTGAPTLLVETVGNEAAAVSTLRTLVTTQSLFYQDNTQQIVPDFTALALADSNVVCEAWLGDSLVAELTGPSEAPPIVLIEGVVGADYCTAIDDTGTTQRFTMFLETGTPLNATDPAGNPIGQVDRLLYYVTPQAFDVHSIMRTDVRGADLSLFTIYAEQATLLGGCLADCDGNGTLNILDFVCYQALFTSGSLDADCDGNGILNILDFVCFQGAFTSGCD